MLRNNEECCRLISMDPGSNTIGIATFDFHPYTVELVSVSAYTLNVTRQLQPTWVADIHSDKYDRIYQIQTHLVDYFKLMQPNLIACESPYISLRTPSAFQALTEVVTNIRAAVMLYSQWVNLDLEDPTSVKKAVGIVGRVSSDKGMVKQAISNIPQITSCLHNDINQLDEHSIDAIAVGWSRLCKLRPPK